MYRDYTLKSKGILMFRLVSETTLLFISDVRIAAQIILNPFWLLQFAHSIKPNMWFSFISVPVKSYFVWSQYMFSSNGGCILDDKYAVGPFLLTVWNVFLSINLQFSVRQRKQMSKALQKKQKFYISAVYIFINFYHEKPNK